ncbi:hypothetical protein [Nocardioides sp. Leaf285]|uniref:hypothetical protein n=1 Tax=Nocardioides sp. Leaf285 TaxID=1736322 RepID=UPI00070321A4|nr:hypothetical protein [Nocardioides sp. Leaf285]KQP66499.1 hypothetical protein ASF47_01505 [Nocardioides sp. Leaf285]
MRLHRALLVLTSFSLALTLGACSGDDGDGDGDQADATPSPSASGPVGDAEKGCTVELTVSGGAEATYSGEARVIRSAQEGQPKAIYMAAWGKDDQNTLNVYQAGGEIETSAVLSLDGSNFASQGSEGIEITRREVTAELPLTGADDESADLAATFTCGRGGKNAD